MIMRINPYLGISRMRRYRMVDMCKAKKIWLRGTDDILIVGLHMVGKRVKVSSLNNMTSFLALYYFSLLLDSSLSYVSYHSSFLFLFFFLFQSLIHIFFFTFLFFYFFIFHIHTFLLTFTSLDIFITLFKALDSSLSCIIQSEILK
jgi:hypothetical protein